MPGQSRRGRRARYEQPGDKPGLSASEQQQVTNASLLPRGIAWLYGLSGLASLLMAIVGSVTAAVQSWPFWAVSALSASAAGLAALWGQARRQTATIQISLEGALDKVGQMEAERNTALDKLHQMENERDTALDMFHHVLPHLQDASASGAQALPSGAADPGGQDAAYLEDQRAERKLLRDLGFE